jgi:hypothetical protein
MKYHDIICDADGWSHLVDGVRSAVFPSWFLAVNAARKSAEQDIRKGLAAVVRYQSADGAMLPVRQKVLPASGLRLVTGAAAPQGEASGRRTG